MQKIKEDKTKTKAYRDWQKIQKTSTLRAPKAEKEFRHKKYLDNLLNKYEESKRDMVDFVDNIHEKEKKEVSKGLDVCKPLARKW